MGHERVEFTTTGQDADDRFLREYVADTAERLESDPACDRFVYIQLSPAEATDTGLVVVDVYGDPEAVIDEEKAVWQEYVDEGVLRDWEVTGVDVPAILEREMGEGSAELSEEIRHLASRMTPLVYETFDEPLSPTDAYPDEPEGMGWWFLLHILSNHQGYTLDEEIDAYAAGIDNNLLNLAGGESPEYALERIDDLIDRLESTRAEIEAGEFPEAPDPDGDGDDREKNAGE